MDDLLALLKHRKLIFTYRYMCCTKGSDISSLTDRIAEKAYRNTGFKITHLNLGFNGRITLYSCYRNQIHIIKGKFCQLRNHGLDKNIGFLRIKPACQIVQSNLKNVMTYFLRMLCIICKCLGICDHNINLII